MLICGTMAGISGTHFIATKGYEHLHDKTYEACCNKRDSTYYDIRWEAHMKLDSTNRANKQAEKLIKK